MKFLSISVASIAVLFSIFTFSPKIQAVDVYQDVCKNTPNATVCKDRKIGNKNPLFGPDSITAKLINLLSFIVGIAAVIGIMLAGLKFITGGDNPQEVATARNMLIYSIVAIVIALSAQLIIRLFLYKIGD